ncbi:MAG: RNA polymerase subunit sigma-70 [Roseburia sp.]|nr:RNA polymerase subunit sigma-70 [Roseburia sp.]MCM1097800.1 RNA polymerase subunit sigma-70 [Ruminococcus flavefaciens]
MEKQILQDYIDACELVEETEKEIRRLSQKKKTIIQTNVKGSSHEFPYTEQHFKVQGKIFTVQDDSRLRQEEKVLIQRKENAERIKVQVEEWLLTIPARMQRIVKYRYLEGLSWERVAVKMGRQVTADSVRKELERFFEKK